MDAIGRTAKGGLSNGGGLKSGTAPSSQISGIATLWSASVHVVALPVLLAVVGFWIICRLRLPVDSPKRRHYAYIRYLTGNADGNNKELRSEGNAKLSSECSIISPFATMTTTNGDPAAGSLLPDSQEDMFFTWDSGGNNDGDAFVHTAVELPKYPDGSITEEERQMLLMYVQSNGPASLTTHNGLGNTSTASVSQTSQRSTGEMSDKLGVVLDNQVMTSRGYLETIVEENSDDLRSPSECDDASLGWGSWDESSELESGSDDDRITVVEVKTSSSSPPSKSSVSSCLARARIESITSNDGSDEDSEEDRSKTPSYAQYLVNKHLSDDESLSSSSLASFVDDAFNSLWECHESLKTDSSCTDSKTYASKANCSEEYDKVESSSHVNNSEAITDSPSEKDNISAGGMGGNEESVNFNSLNVPAEFDHTWEVSDSDCPLRLIPSKVNTCDSKDTAKDFRCFLTNERYVHSTFGDNLSDIGKIPSNVTCKNYDSLLSIETAPTYLPDGAISENSKIRCFRIGFGTDFEADRASNSVGVISKGKEISKNNDDEKTDHCESNDQYEALFSPRQGDVSFSSVRFDCHPLKEPEISNEERQVSRPDISTPKNASVNQAGVPFPTLSCVSDNNEGKITGSGKLTLSRWQHHPDLQKIDLEEVAGSVARWRHDTENPKAKWTAENMGSGASVLAGDNEIDQIADDVVGNNSHWNLYKSFKIRSKMSRIRLSEAKNNNFKALGLWENETKVTLPPFGLNLIENSHNTENEYHNENLGQKEEDLDDLELDMFATSNESCKSSELQKSSPVTHSDSKDIGSGHNVSYHFSTSEIYENDVEEFKYEINSSATSSNGACDLSNTEQIFKLTNDQFFKVESYGKTFPLLDECDSSEFQDQSGNLRSSSLQSLFEARLRGQCENLSSAEYDKEDSQFTLTKEFYNAIAETNKFQSHGSLLKQEHHEAKLPEDLILSTSFEQKACDLLSQTKNRDHMVSVENKSELNCPEVVIHEQEHVENQKYSNNLNQTLETGSQKFLSPCTSLDSDDGIELCSKNDRGGEIKPIPVNVNCDMKHDDSGYVEDDDEDEEEAILEEQDAGSKSSRKFTEKFNDQITLNLGTCKIPESAGDEVCSCVNDAKHSQTRNLGNQILFNYDDFSEELKDNHDTKVFSSLTCDSTPSEFSTWLLDKEVEKVSSKDMMDKLIENHVIRHQMSRVCACDESTEKVTFDLSSEKFPMFELYPDVPQKVMFASLSDNRNLENLLQGDDSYFVINKQPGNNSQGVNSTDFKFSEDVKIRKSHSEEMPFECTPENYGESGAKISDLFYMEKTALTDMFESSHQMENKTENYLTDTKITPLNNSLCSETKSVNTSTGALPPAYRETPSVNQEVTSSSNNKAGGADIFDNNNDWATMNSRAAERNLLLNSPHEPFHDPDCVQLSGFAVRGLSRNETESAENIPGQDNEYLQDNVNTTQCNSTLFSKGADVLEKPHVDIDCNNSVGIATPSIGLECNLLDKQIGDDVVAAPLPFDPVTHGVRRGVGEVTCFREGSQDGSSLGAIQPETTPVIILADVTLTANTTQHVCNDASFAVDLAPTTRPPSETERVLIGNTSDDGSCNVASPGSSGSSPKEDVYGILPPSVGVKSASDRHETASFGTGDDLVLTICRKIRRPVEYRRSKSLVRETKDRYSDSVSPLMFTNHSKSTPDLRGCNDVLLTSNIPLSALLSKSVSQRIQEYLGESSKGSNLKRTLPQTERSRHYQRICSSTETVVEKAARFEARYRSSSQGSRPLAVTTGIPRIYSAGQQRSGSCPPLTDTFSRNKDNSAMLSTSFNKSQHLLPRSKPSCATGKPTATVRPSTERNRDHMLNSNKVTCEVFETDNINNFHNPNSFASFSVNKIISEPKNTEEDLFERITGYNKASVRKQPLTEKPPLPPSSNIRGRIASARKDFFERLSNQETNIRKKHSYEAERASLERFDRFRKSARAERERLAASHPDLGALEAEVRSSRRRIDQQRKNTVLSKSDSLHDGTENNQEGDDPSVGALISNTTAGKERTRICTPYRRCTGEIAWASCAKRLEQEKLKSRSQGYLETDVDSHLQRSSPAGSPSGPLQPAEESLRAHSLLSLGEDDTRPESVAICEELHCNARARSMDFLLDADNREATLPPENKLGSGQGRVKSEHELRIERSLQNLTIPDWYKQSPWSKKPKEGFILRRGSEGSAGESRKRWQGFGSSRTPSASSLTSSSYSQRNVTPKRMTSASEWRYTGSLMSSRESLPPASPASLSPRDCTAFQYGLTSLSRWSSSRLSTNSAPLSAWSVHRSFRQPYLGWRAATASSAQTPSSGGSRSSPGMSPAASTPIYGSRPVSPRRPSTHDHQARDSSTLRPEAGDTSETNRISPLALYDNANGVFFSSAAELMVPKSFTEDVSSKVKIHTGMYDERLRSSQWPEIRRDRYSYTQSLCNSATLFSPPGTGHHMDTAMREDRWTRPTPPRVWMESSFVGTKKNTTDNVVTSNIKPKVISESKDQADDRSSTSFSRSTAPSSSFRSSCAPPRQMGEYVLRDFRRFGITL